MKITKRIHTGLISALCAISYLLVSVGSGMLTAHAEMVHQEAKEPTCTENGVESRTLKGSDEVKEYRDINLLGHSYKDWEIVIEPNYLF